MSRMRSVWWVPGLVILVAASCRYQPLPDLADGGDGSSSDDAPSIDDAPSDVGPPSFDLELLAGNIGGGGNLDGVGDAARFRFPYGVAVDSVGNVYVADSGNLTIRKVTAAGIVTTLAGTAGMSGSTDNTGAAASFVSLKGAAVDSAGNVYTADYGNHTIRKITSTGVVTTLAGTATMSGSVDGTGAAARFRYPAGVAVDNGGNVYVADEFNHTIRKITSAGSVTTLAGTAGMPGSADGTGAAARFDNPDGVAVDSAGNVYVADADNHTIRKVTPTGIVTTLAGTASMSGSANGTGAAARFYFPRGVAVDTAENVYVADEYNNTIRKITAAGSVTTLAGTAGLQGSEDGTGATARLRQPRGVAVDNVGNVYVADWANSTIRKITPAGVVTTLAGSATLFGSADGTGAAARFYSPIGVAVDSTGNVYVANSSSDSIRKVTAAGSVTTLAGSGPGSTDGTGIAARFFTPYGAAVDSNDNIYVTDQGNHTIRKITPAGDVTTLAGSAGMVGSADGTGGVARFKYPSGVAVDSAGYVYVADRDNCTIRKITPAGVVTTLAGTAGMYGSADGTGAAPRFRFPHGLAVDSAGYVYVADWGNHTIRKISPAGVVTTLAGTAGMYGSADGTGVAARFYYPSDVVVDRAGNIYVGDNRNSIIRKVTPTGTTTTIGGMAGAAGIILGATPRFAFPVGLAISGDSIVISDTNAILLLRHSVQ